MRAELFILSVIVYEVSAICSPLNLNFINFPETPKRSRPFVIGVTVIKCPGTGELHYRWQVKDATGAIVQNDDRSSITIDGYKYGSKNIFRKDFNVTVRLSHYQNMSASSSISKSFRFRLDKRNLEIKGGVEKTHPYETPLIIDAEPLSRDFNFPLDKNTFKGNSISWNIKRKIPRFTPPLNIRYTAAPQFLNPNQVYKFQVAVSRFKKSSDVDTQRANQTVAIVSQDSSAISITCRRNCINPNVNEATTLTVTCSGHCKDVRYEWSTDPELGPDKIDLGDGNDALVMQPGAFSPGDKVTVTVRGRESSFCTYSVAFVSRMTKGTCEVTPKEGISGVTLFKVQCKGFKSANGDLTYKICQKSGAEGSGVILSEKKSIAEHYIQLSMGSPADIVVFVQDEAYVQEKVELQVLVKPLSSEMNTSVVDIIKALVLKPKSDSVVSLSKKGHRNKVVQMVSYLLDAMNSAESITDSEKSDLHEHMAQSFLRLKPCDFASAKQCISILTKFEKFKLVVDTYTSRLLGNAILLSAMAMHKMASHGKDSTIPVHFLYEFGQSVVELSSGLLKKVPEIETELQQKTPPHDYESYDELVSTRLKMKDDLRDMTDNILISLLLIGSSMIHRNIPDEKVMILKSKLITFTTRRVRLTSMLSNRNISLSNETESKITVSEPLVRELQEKYTFIDYQFAVLKENSFWWHPNSSILNTEIVHFDLLYYCRRISSTKNPFYVYLKTKSIPIGVLNGTVTGSDIRAHQIKVEPDFLLIVLFKPSSAAYKVTSSDCYCDEEDFDRGLEIRGDANESQRTLLARPSKNKNFIYVCVKSLEGTLNYEGSFSAFSCAYWDLKEGRWNSGSCKTQQITLQNGDLMVCECTHASWFAGLILVPPNRINLNSELNFHILSLTNWTVLVTIALSWVFWSCFFICACYRDKRLAEKNIVCKLDDNVPGDSHEYLMVVFTGMFIDAGTTADVGFQIIGEKAKSRVHLMRSEGVGLLERNSQDWFIIHTPCFLGKLIKISLWHNCKGKHPHWYCRRIVVEHLKSGVQYCFIVEKWFSLVWGDGKICREIIATEETGLNFSKQMFLVKMERDFNDKYVWVNVFLRDPQSNFSSKERVGAAMSVFYLSMFAQLLLYGVPENTPIDSIDPKSSFFISLSDVLILFLSLLIAGSVGLLITLLFRNSSPESGVSIWKKLRRRSR